MKDQIIMVDLDALFDTRIATIAGLNPETGIKLIANDRYRKRTNANWTDITNGAITTEAFNEAYRNRDKETLTRATITKMPEIIGEFTKSLQWRGIVKIDVDKVSIKVNTWPYKFTSDEKRVLRDCMAQYTSATATIEFVHVSLQDMIPSRLDELADIWITYEYNDWIAMHQDNLLRYRIPMMTILVPQVMYNEELINEEDYTDKELGGTYDPFKVHQVTMSEFIGVEFYPPFTFSSVLEV